MHDSDTRREPDSRAAIVKGEGNDDPRSDCGSVLCAAGDWSSGCESGGQVRIFGGGSSLPVLVDDSVRDAAGDVH